MGQIPHHAAGVILEEMRAGIRADHPIPEVPTSVDDLEKDHEREETGNIERIELIPARKR